MRGQNWVLGPAKVNEVGEPHESEVAEIAHNENTNCVQVRQVLHSDDQVQIDSKNERGERRDWACPEICRVAFGWAENAWIAISNERDVKDDSWVDQTLELSEEELSAVEIIPILSGIIE